MRLIILLFIVSFSIYCKSDESEKTYETYFLDYWRNSLDINFQLSTYYGFDLDDSNYDIVKKKLKKAIHFSSNKYTIHQADKICHDIEDLTQWCHNKKIHQIHYQIDPNNVNTYLLNLHNTDSDKQISNVLNKASINSKFSDSYFLKSYLNNTSLLMDFHNKYPDQLYSTNGEDIQSIISEINQATLDNKLKEKGLAVDSINSIVNYIFSSYSGGMTAMQQSNPLFLFSELCKKEIYTQNCNTLSRIMINSSDSNLTYVTGRRDWEVFTDTSKKLKLDESEIITIKANNNYSKVKIRCYNSPKDVEFSSYYNISISQQYHQDQLILGELKTSKRLAYKVYEIIKKHGYHPDFNPNDCKS